jgi:hypothetical protein
VYHPFPEDSAKWCAYTCSLDRAGFWGGTYQLNGKVLINGNLYSRMLTHNQYCTPPPGMCICGQLPGTIDTFYIRQDTATRKVWLYNQSTNSDTIFLDFDLNVGDTIDARKAYWASQWTATDTFIVSSIDSMLIDGQYRTKYNYPPVGNTWCNNSIIEGIGPLHGFFYGANNCFEHENSLVVFSQNDRIVLSSYSDTTYAKNYYCHDFTTDITEPNHYSFSISPNPTHNQLNVECNLQNAKLKIYDVMGREVYATTLNSKHQTLNPSLSPAIYFVRVNDGEKVAVQKLIVE